MIGAQIRQAEAALAGGRLDEAGALLEQASLRQMRRGQQLLTELVTALTARAKAHLLAERLHEALADCRAAERLGGNLADVAAIRDAATAELLAAQRRLHREAQVLSIARRQIEQGQLNLAEQVICDAAAEPLTASILRHSGGGALLHDIETRRAALAAACAAAEEALTREDTDRATAELERARQADRHDPRVADLEARLRTQLSDALAGALDTGRPDLAEALAGRLRRCGRLDTVGESLCRALDQCRAAWQWVQRGAPRQAAQILRRVAAARPSARWVDGALQQLAQAEQQIDLLRGGALGMLANAPDAASPSSPGSPTSPDHATIAPGASGQTYADPIDPSADPTAAPDAPLPDRFLMQVDGAGSFCVVTAAAVSIGPVSSPRRPDVGLVAEPGTPIATLERKEDDYFLRGESGVAVNDQPVLSRLLRPGDRIALAARCRVTFQLPHPASTTAALDLSAARYPRGDVRRIILLDQDLIIGPGAAHVRCDTPRPIAFRWRDRRLLPPSGVEMRVAGQVWPPGRGLPLGVPAELGGVRLVLTRI